MSEDVGLPGGLGLGPRPDRVEEPERLLGLGADGRHVLDRLVPAPVALRRLAPVPDVVVDGADRGRMGH